MRGKGLFSLSESVAIVTGSLGLLGREHVSALAGAGANVVCLDLDGAEADEQAQDTQWEFDVKCLGLAASVTDPESLEEARARIISELGRIDVLVNNAAIDDKFEDPLLAASQSRFEDYPLEMWRRHLDVNVTGTFLPSKVFGPVMVENGRGSIINIASTYGIVAPDQSLYRREDGSQDFWKSAAYPASKGAVLSFTRFLAAYWGPAGVRTNALSPGGVENDQDAGFVERYSARTPLGRMAAPHDYHGALVFLASPASRYVNGANLVVDGGFTIW